MSTYISSSVVVSGGYLSTNAGVIGYNNIINVGNITATSELSTNPITQVANASTSYIWRAANTNTQTITIQADGQTVDYIGLARHNLNQVGLRVQIKFNGVVVTQEQAVSGKQALLYLQAEAAPATIDIIITGATEAPAIGVIYVGKALRLERNIYVGHTPITYGRDRKTISGISENGQFLGEIVVSESNTTSVSLANLTPDWYRKELDPFFALTPRVPCFWAWRPGDYKDEVGYCWLEGEPSMSNQSSNGLVQADFSLRGIV